MLIYNYLCLYNTIYLYRQQQKKSTSAIIAVSSESPDISSLGGIGEGRKITSAATEKVKDSAGAKTGF